MAHPLDPISKTKKLLIERLNTLEPQSAILRAKELRDLYSLIPTLPEKERGAFGKAVNDLKNELGALVSKHERPMSNIQRPIDVTAPFDTNTTPEQRPRLLPTEQGTIHPLMRELDQILDIFARMGFSALESRQLDDDWHMFTSLNFPEDHPARDDYDTFMTTEGFVAPAHTSTMQNRVLTAGKELLKNNEAIRTVIPGRVFRNEDLDATHEHTFYQLEGVYVDKGITVGHLIATLKEFMQAYFGQKLAVKVQPFYFPFTEPSFEFAIERPQSLRKGTSAADEWLEILGCGMIHPHVLTMAGIDPNMYTGFAWGGGIERLVLMKYSIEDIRHFHSGKLDFLRQFR